MENLQNKKLHRDMMWNNRTFYLRVVMLLLPAERQQEKKSRYQWKMLRTHIVPGSGGAYL